MCRGTSSRSLVTLISLSKLFADVFMDNSVRKFMFHGHITKFSPYIILNHIFNSRKFVFSYHIFLCEQATSDRYLLPAYYIFAEHSNNFTGNFCFLFTLESKSSYIFCETLHQAGSCFLTVTFLPNTVTNSQGIFAVFTLLTRKFHTFLC